VHLRMTLLLELGVHRRSGQRRRALLWRRCA
jgi:hypothetical protein